MGYKTYVYIFFGMHLISDVLLDNSFDTWNNNERAVTFDLKSCDDHTGQCTTRIDCNRRGGIIEGRCSLPMLVCCKTELKCGNTTSQKVSHFSNGVSQPSSTCTLQIKPTNRRICQLRIDFESFALAPPRSSNNNSAYSCIDDSFAVTSNSDRNFQLPPLCGEYNDQHIYIPVNVTNINSVISTLTFQISNGSSPVWKLKISQLECAQTSQQQISKHFKTIRGTNLTSSWFQKIYDVIAPSGCLQYYTTNEGTFTSFNYNNGQGPYIANLRYSICFKRPAGACGIRFIPVSFQVGFNSNAAGSTERDCDQRSGSNPLINDYLLIPDGRMASGIQASKYCNNALSANNSITTTVPAPWFVLFRSGSQRTPTDVQRGFEINYSVLFSGCN